MRNSARGRCIFSTVTGQFRPDTAAWSASHLMCCSGAGMRQTSGLWARWSMPQRQEMAHKIPALYHTQFSWGYQCILNFLLRLSKYTAIYFSLYSVLTSCNLSTKFLLCWFLCVQLSMHMRLISQCHRCQRGLAPNIILCCVLVSGSSYVSYDVAD